MTSTSAMTTWSATWIEPDDRRPRPRVQRPVYLLAGTFSAESIEEAALRITALGLYEVFVNGERVGDHELTPGFTSYRHRIQVQTYDVLSMLHDGDNTIGVMLSDGWWRGQNTIGRRTDAYGSTVSVLAEIAITDRSGGRTCIGTDASWVWAPSHILSADLIAGEVHDMRLRRDDWCAPGTDRAHWSPVVVADHGFDRLVETTGPPVRRQGELSALSVTDVGPRRHIVDFGQVSNGWVRLTDLGPADTQLTIVHSETLTPAGDDVQIKALAEGGVTRHEGWDLCFQTDVVISAGPRDVFEPRHSTKGFRYVRIDGHPGPLDPADITSVVVHSELAPIGGFECSDDDLNWLHRATDWSLRTNCCDIPTDCPTRERAGWTGDWQIFIDVAARLYDVTKFSAKWLADVVAEQLPGGEILNFVPDPANHGDERVAWWTALQGSAGWGDAIVHVPWELYRATGDPHVLEPSYDAMCRWVDFAAGRAASGRHPTRVAERPEPADHERFLWDSGFHFGEWNEPGFRPNHPNPDDEASNEGASNDEVKVPDLAAELLAQDHGPTATAYLYRSSSELARIASILGRGVDADHYGALAEDVLAAWRAEFIGGDGRVTPGTQANLVRALAFGLAPDDHVDSIAAQLVERVRAADTHLGTGFLATPMLLPVLADHGHLDVAYELLFQRTAPSWLAMRDQGATTIWEGWTPFDDSGQVRESLNHFSMGAVIGFLHRYVAGLELVDPGWSRLRIAPRPGGGLTHARAHHDGPRGHISVSWTIDGGTGRITVEIPEETTAELVLPGQQPEELGVGTRRRTWEADA